MTACPGDLHYLFKLDLQSWWFPRTCPDVYCDHLQAEKTREWQTSIRIPNFMALHFIAFIFLQTWVFWKLCIEQVTWCNFPNNFCSLSFWLHSVIFTAISDLFIVLYLLWWSVIIDPWCYYESLKVQMMVSIFLAIK